MTEKKISGLVAYSGSFLKVEKDQVMTSKGQQASREYIQHPGASLIIPVMNNGDLIMVRQFRYAMKQFYLEFPAGKLDPGETPAQAALRELQEEIQMTCQRLESLTSIHPCIGYSNEVIHLFIARELSPFEAKPDADEDLEIVKVTATELKQKILAQQLPDVKTQIAAWWYFDLLANLQGRP